MVSSAASTSDLLLLDTNILIMYARQGEPAERLERQLGLQSERVEGVVSIVTIGEAFAFAKKNNWGEPKRDALKELIRTRLVPIDIHRPEILDAYAEIYHYCAKVEKPARPIGQNDLWIAATAHVVDCTLVTMDTDFKHLDGKYLRLRLIDPKSLKP